MSFGFSIGDFVILSQLAYKVYTSIGAGRKAASRDLQELEDVLFSLKCSLDHLGNVSEDVLARALTAHAGPDLTDNLNRMISACGRTLQELDTVTKKYRETGIDPIGDPTHTGNKSQVKKRRLDDVKHSIKTNWTKVRWDQEKQSLQQYRDKVTSHTDAINLILTTAMWSNTTYAHSASTTNHEKTQLLIKQVLSNPQMNLPIHTMIEDIHAILTTPQAGIGDQFLTKAMLMSSVPAHPEYAGPDNIQADNLAFKHQSRLGSLAMRPLSVPVNDLQKRLVQPLREITEKDILGSSFVGHAHTAYAHVAEPSRQELSPETIQLNIDRRARGRKEFDAFKKLYARPNKIPKPAFLSATTSNVRDLQLGLAYLFQQSPSGKQEIDEHGNDVRRWTRNFASFVESNEARNDESTHGLLLAITALNAAVEKSSKQSRQLFYQASDSAGFTEALETLQNMTKSVRVMKEIEEFQDVKEEWENE